MRDSEETENHPLNTMANDVGANAPGAAFGARRTEGAPAAVAFGAFVVYGPVAQKLDLNLLVAERHQLGGAGRKGLFFSLENLPVATGVPSSIVKEPCIEPAARPWERRGSWKCRAPVCSSSSGVI